MGLYSSLHHFYCQILLLSADATHEEHSVEINSRRRGGTEVVDIEEVHSASTV